MLKADDTTYADVDLVSIFQFEVNIGWTNGGICQLSRSGCVTSRFSTQGWYPDTNTNAAANHGVFSTRQGYLI